MICEIKSPIFPDERLRDFKFYLFVPEIGDVKVVVCDLKRFFAETPKPNIIISKCRNSAVTEISAIRAFSAENGCFGHNFGQIWGIW